MVDVNGVETENVVTPLDTDMSEGGILEVEDSHLDDAHAQAERVVKQAHDQSGTKGQIEIIVETGEPAETILTNIDTENVDHVVMGGHGGPRIGVLPHLLGTIATTVVSNTSVTVTVVR